MAKPIAISVAIKNANNVILSVFNVASNNSLRLSFKERKYLLELAKYKVV